MNNIDFSIFKQEVAEELGNFAKHFGQVFQVLEQQMQAYEAMSRHIIELKHKIEDLEHKTKSLPTNLSTASETIRTNGVEL